MNNNKFNFKKEHQIFKSKFNRENILEFDSFNSLMISGKGSPDHEDFSNAIKELYPKAYKIKFIMKQKGQDFIVPPLMGLWYADDMKVFKEDKKEEWKWDLMIPIPSFVKKEIILENIKDTNILLKENKLGTVVSTLHIGPYPEEGPVIEKMHKYSFDNGYKLHGKHIEIYIGDPRRSSPEKLKTILGQQIRKSI